MATINLPTDEETTLTINLKDKSVVIDMFDYEQLKDRVIRKLKDLNLLSDYNALIDFFRQEMISKYDLPMSKLAASELMSFADDYYDEVKKKYFERLNSLDSTDSTPAKSEPLVVPPPEPMPEPENSQIEISDC